MSPCPVGISEGQEQLQLEKTNQQSHRNITSERSPSLQIQSGATDGRIALLAQRQLHSYSWQRIILPITTHGKMRHPADYDNLD